MNPRRSKSVKLVSSYSQPLEVEIVESSQMSSSVDNTVYCCVAKGNKIIYSYSSKDQDLENLAVRCLENAPSYHSWYFHTVGIRTFGFLAREGYTYFAIVEPSLGNLAILQFLEHVRDGFKKMSKNGFDDDLVPIIKRLIASLEKMPKQSDWLDSNLEGLTSSDGSPSKAPLLGKSNARHLDKKKDKVVEDGDKLGDHADRVVKIDVPMETPAMPLRRSLSSGRVRAQQAARSLWLRKVMIIIVADIIICVVLFGVWLGVCRGFNCLSKK